MKRKNSQRRGKAIGRKLFDLSVLSKLDVEKHYSYPAFITGGVKSIITRSKSRRLIELNVWDMLWMSRYRYCVLRHGWTDEQSVLQENRKIVEYTFPPQEKFYIVLFGWNSDDASSFDLNFHQTLVIHGIRYHNDWASIFCLPDEQDTVRSVLGNSEDFKLEDRVLPNFVIFPTELGQG